MAIVGGSKVSTKLELLGNLSSKGRHPRHRRRHGQHLPRRPRASIRRPQPCRKPRCTQTALDILDQRRARPAAAIVLPDRRRRRPRVPGERALRGPCAIAAIPADAMMLDVGPATVEALEAKRLPDRKAPSSGTARSAPSRRRTVRRRDHRPGPSQSPTPPPQGASPQRWPAAATPSSALRHAGVTGAVQLRQLRRRRLPRVARGQDPARRRGASGLTRGDPPCATTPPPCSPPVPSSRMPPSLGSRWRRRTVRDGVWYADASHNRPATARSGPAIGMVMDCARRHCWPSAGTRLLEGARHRAANQAALAGWIGRGQRPRGLSLADVRPPSPGRGPRRGRPDARRNDSHRGNSIPPRPAGLPRPNAIDRLARIRRVPAGGIVETQPIVASRSRFTLS